MAAAQNETDICNLALDHLNVAPITTITNPTDKIGKICERWYDNTRKACLRMHTWNFAKKKVTVAKDATAPTHTYTARYKLPSDYIRILSIGEYNHYKDYDIQEGYLLLNETSTGSLKFSYVFDQKAVEKFDPLFVELVALEMAYNISFPVTGHLGMKNTLRAERDEKRREAFTVDGQERPPRRRERSQYKMARRKQGYYGSPYIEEN